MEFEIAGGNPGESFSCSCNDGKSHATTHNGLNDVVFPSRVGAIYN